MKPVMIVMILSIFFSGQVYAHDEGHGPHISDTGKYGGLISGVIAKSQADLGAKAAVVYKAELVRSATGTVRVYLFSESMKPLDLKSFRKQASGSLEAKVKGKLKATSFALEVNDGVFIGQMPKAEAKPYSIEVVFLEGDKELLVAFDSLD